MKSYTIPKVLKILLLTVVYAFAEECIKKDSCSCATDSGFQVDLHPLDTSSSYRFESKTNDYTYRYRPCQSFSEGDCHEVALCQSSAKDFLYFVIGYQDSAEFQGDPNAGTLSLSFKDDQVGGTKRSSTINLKCSKEEGVFTFIEEQQQPDPHYIFQLDTRYACRDIPVSGGLSVGSILLITFFVLLFVYIVGGMLFLRFVRDARGVDMIPNFSFWKEVPFLAKDGCVFVFHCCKRDSTYDQI